MEPKSDAAFERASCHEDVLNFVRLLRDHESQPKRIIIRELLGAEKCQAWHDLPDDSRDVGVDGQPFRSPHAQSPCRCDSRWRGGCTLEHEHPVAIVRTKPSAVQRLGGLNATNPFPLIVTGDADAVTPGSELLFRVSATPHL